MAAKVSEREARRESSDPVHDTPFCAHHDRPYRFLADKSNIADHSGRYPPREACRFRLVDSHLAAECGPYRESSAACAARRRRCTPVEPDKLSWSPSLPTCQTEGWPLPE